MTQIIYRIARHEIARFRRGYGVMDADITSNLENTERRVHCFSSDDRIIINETRRDIHIFYSPARTSVPPFDLTKIEVLIHPHTGTVWIAWLHIAFSFRSAGLGRQLVRAAEGIAHALGLCVVNVFPLYGSHPFWLKLGYQSHPYTSRVLCKHLPAPLCQRTIRSGNEKNGRSNIMAPKSV